MADPFRKHSKPGGPAPARCRSPPSWVIAIIAAPTGSFLTSAVAARPLARVEHEVSGQPRCGSAQKRQKQGKANRVSNGLSGDLKFWIFQEAVEEDDEFAHEGDERVFLGLTVQENPIGSGLGVWGFYEPGLPALVGWSRPGGDLAADVVDITDRPGFRQAAVGHRAAAFQFGGDRQLPVR